MKLIALTGLHGAGKDTVADALPARKLAFADVLYREVAAAWNVPLAALKCRETKEMPSYDLALAMCDDGDFYRWAKFKPGNQLDPRSPRQILQWWGDYRRAQDPGYFVKRTRLSIEATLLDPPCPVVITDVRFPNEAAMVRQLGGQIWQVVRPGHEPPRTGHASETTGDEFAPDRVLVNDGSLDDLKREALSAWAAY